MTTWAVKDPTFDSYRALYRLLGVAAIVIYVSKYFLKTTTHSPKKKERRASTEKTQCSSVLQWYFPPANKPSLKENSEEFCSWRRTKLQV